MTSFRGLAACALAFSVSLTAKAQQRPDLSPGARVKVSVTPLGKDKGREDLAYVTRLDADSLHYRVVRQDAATAVPWERVSALKVSDGARMTSLGTHVLGVGGATAFGAVLGWFTWHSCSQQPGYAITLDCVLTPARLGPTTRGGAALGAGIGVLYSLAHLKTERWRVVPTPGALRLSVRRAGGGVGVGVAIAF